MPTVHDLIANGEEARDALRALAHATRGLDNPAQAYAVVGDLLGGLRSLEQVLDQLAFAHTSTEAIARADDGDHWAGVEEAFAAATALRRASNLIARAGLAMNRASQHSSRIAWEPALSTVSPPVAESIVPRLNSNDSFQRTTAPFEFERPTARVHRRPGRSL